PISIRSETNEPEIFYQAIAARLAKILGEELPPPATAGAAYFEDQCRILLETAVDRNRRILLVVDGIDEALVDSFSIKWFPREPNNCLRLLVSARSQAGATDAYEWATALGWEPNKAAAIYDLTTLDAEAVRQLFRSSGILTCALADDPKVIANLTRLSG